MFDEFGMLSERCGCSFQRGHFVVAKNDIIVHNGSSWESVIDLKNRKAVFGSISNDYKEWTFVAHNPAKSEIYTCYVTTGNVYANRVAIWNYRDNTWTFDDLPGIAHGALGLDVTDTTTMTFDNLVGSFDEWQGTFDERRYNPAELNLFLADPVNTLFYRENVGTQRNGSDYSSWVERTGIAVAKMDRNNEPVIDLNSVKFVRGFWPKITGKVGVQINFYFATQDKPQDPVTWKGPFPFVIGTDTFVDFEISTVLYGVRASSTSDGDWEMSGYDVDLDVISRF